jgi:hypothetical protein
MEDVGIFYVHLVNFPVIWHILWPFGKISPRFGTLLSVLVCCTKKNLAILHGFAASLHAYAITIRRDQIGRKFSMCKSKQRPHFDQTVSVES